MSIIGVRPWWMVRSSGLDVSTRALLAAMTTQQTSERISAIDTAIKRFKFGNIWERVRLLYDLCAVNASDSLINWINPSEKTLTVLNTPLHEPNKGWRRDTAGVGRLTLGRPLGSYDKFYSYDAHLSVYISNFTPSSGIALGSEGGNSYAWVDKRDSGTVRGSLNSANLDVVNSVSDKFFTISSRPGSVNIICAGQNKQVNIVARTPAPTGIFYIIGRSTVSSTNNTIGFASAGGAIDDLHQLYSSIVNDYMTAIGNGGPL